MLELIDLKKTYVTKAGDTVALNGVNLVFPDSGMVFITGKSGSGKTTLLNVIGGLDKFDSGDISIDGKKFSEFSPADYDSYRNTFIGFVFQEYNLLTEYTIEKNIDIANELQGRNSDKQEVENLLKIVDIEGYSARKPNQLSGGQKQRVAIARALIKNPKIIMADEPTGALDSATGIQVMDLLKKLSKEKLVIVVSHELEFAEKYADRIIKIVDGSVVEDISLSDVEINGNVFVDDKEMSVKSGSKLNENEKEMLVQAIEDKKKINVIEKISIRQKKDTAKIEVKNPDKPVKLINSKMKFKSVSELGFKSLFVKPVRLIFTILLSVIAFSVFGLFDSVASYNSSRALTNLLRDSYYPSVSTYLTYSDDNYDKAELKMSKEYIDKLSSKTGYSFKGILDINEINNDDDSGRLNFNRQYSLFNSFAINNPKGKNYYMHDINGFIEFNNEQIQNMTTIDPNGFNYKILYGEYPKLLEKQDECFEVGISSYLAESIMFWSEKTNQPYQFGGKEILKIEDLIGAIFKLSISGIQKEFCISAIIDCGEIPEKYDKLKFASSSQERALADDFITFLNSGAYLTLFAPDGYEEFMCKKNKTIPEYVANYEYMEYLGLIKNSSADLSYTFYNSENFNGTNSILIDDIKNGIPQQDNKKVVLKENEILVSLSNLELLYKSEMQCQTTSNVNNTIELTINKINEVASTVEKKREYLADLVTISEQVRNDNPAIFADNKADKIIKIYARKDGVRQFEKEYIVKGFYFDVNLDKNISKYSSAYYPFVMSDAGFNNFGITKNQGNYSRAIAPLTSNYFGAKTLSNIMTSDSGERLIWYENSVLDNIEYNSQFISQFSRLFLYVALVVVVFAVLMLFNYIATSIFSKRHSIGTLRALGASGFNIFQMFMIESMIISIVNGILASIVSYIACIFVNIYIVEIMNLSIQFALFGARQIIIIFIASIVTGFLSSLSPILKIAKEKPVDLIRKE